MYTYLVRRSKRYRWGQTHGKIDIREEKIKKETETKREKQRQRDGKTTYTNMYTYRMYLSCTPIRTPTQNNKLGTAT